MEENNGKDNNVISRRSFLKGLFASLPIAAVASHAEKSEAYFTDTNKNDFGNTKADATSLDIDAKIDARILEKWFPVGSIYMTMDSKNPHDIFGGGTWEQISGRFLLAADGKTYQAGSIGGSADAVVVSHDHSLSAKTDSQSTDHNHTVDVYDGYHSHYMKTEFTSGYHAGNGLLYTNGGTVVRNQTIGTNSETAQKHTRTTTTNKQSHSHSFSTTTANTGEPGTGKNMPPYLAVYIWKRIS